MDNKVNDLAKLGALYELLGKCKEIVQGEGLVGGHRSYVDDMLTDVKNEVHDALEKLKSEFK